MEDLQRFVTDRALSCDDTKEIAKWAQGQRYLYVLIYKDDQLLFESGQYEEENNSEDTEKEEMGEGSPGDSKEDEAPGDNVDGGADVGGETGNGDGTENSGDASNDTDTPDTNGSDSSSKDEDANKEDNKYPSSGITVKTPTREELIAEAVAGGSYPIVASDGV